MALVNDVALKLRRPLATLAALLPLVSGCSDSTRLLEPSIPQQPGTPPGQTPPPFGER